MTDRLHIDFETRSTIDLRKTGVYRYAEHPTTDLWCVCYTLNHEEEVGLWLPGQEIPEPISMALLTGATFVAHNKDFERIMWKGVLAPRYGWPEPDLEQWDCTAAKAAAMGLPRSLDGAASVISRTIHKDEAGHRVMLQVCKPRLILEKEDARYAAAIARAAHDTRTFTVLPDGRIVVWWNVPDKLQRLYDYCIQDVRAERAVDNYVLNLGPAERKVWLLDAKINDRGFACDLQLIENAQKIVDAEAKKWKKEINDLTKGFVDSATNVAALKMWADLEGVPLDRLDKEVLAEQLKREDLPTPVERALRIRSEVGKSSTSKLKAFQNRTCADGRVHGAILYHGAHTGRWSGAGVQPQNLLRFPKGMDVWLGLRGLLEGWTGEMLSLIVGPPMQVVAACMRPVIRAAEGQELIAADLSNIEGRVNAAINDENWKLQAFREFDAGIGRDLYLLAAEGIYDVPAGTFNENSPERQIGKVAELALGYQGGINAFHNMAKNYGVRLTDKEADKTKIGFRKKNPNIVQGWEDMEDAALCAVADPGSKHDCCGGRITFMMKNNFLWMRLPNNRLIAYARPSIRQKTWNVKVYKEETDTLEDVTMTRDAVHFYGVNQRTRKWDVLTGYGGFWCENAVQAISRDVMAEGMLRLEEAGYPIVLTVHDEIVSEIPKGFGSVKEFEGLMAQAPAWLSNLPISAKGWRGERYRK